MKKISGIVTEIFVPEKKLNGIKIEDIDSNEIGFKIKIGNTLITIIEKQNGKNTRIYKGDKVMLITERNDDKDIIKIKLCEDNIHGN